MLVPGMAWARRQGALGKARRACLLREQMQGGPQGTRLHRISRWPWPLGWVGVAVRTETPRLVSSRTIPAVDDLPVWSMGCSSGSVPATGGAESPGHSWTAWWRPRSVRALPASRRIQSMPRDGAWR